MIGSYIHDILGMIILHCPIEPQERGRNMLQLKNIKKTYEVGDT